MKQDDSGPAFPNANTSIIRDSDGNELLEYPPRTSGLTKREWFAGMALQGILSNNYDKICEDGTSPKIIAMDCLSFADHILEYMDEESKK